jgi:aspartate/methionine/tyrosine aminotransferase
MRFDTIQYIEWFKKKSPAGIDLCSSGVDPIKGEDLDIDWAELDATGENFYGYTPLIEAIADRYKVKSKNVVTTIGTSHALFLASAALVEPGDVVVIETPAYEPLLAVPKAFDAQISRLPRRFEDSYGFSIDEFSSLLTPQTKFALLTNLHNPSGALLSRSFLEDVVDLAGEKNIYVIIDEIYLEFLDGESTAFHLADNVIVISSLTKAFGLGHLRCGWILAPPDLVERMRRIIDYTNVEATFIGEEIAFHMFGRMDEIKGKNKGIIDRNKDLVKDLIDNEESLSWVEPADGVVCFPRIESGLSGDELASILRKEYDTAVVPGRFFEQPRHFRVGFGGDSNILAEGLANLRDVLSKSPSS